VKQKKKHCSRESYAGTFNANSNGTNKCKSKIYHSMDSKQPNGVSFMINWFIEWSQRPLLQHVLLSIICAQNVKLVMKEMVAG